MLLDHNLPHDLRRLLPSHDVWTTRFRGWDLLDNGDLLRAAADDGFDLLLTIDKAMEHERNLSRLPLPIVQLDAKSPKIGDLRPFLPAVLALLAAGPLAPALYVIAADGAVTVLTAPRPKP